MYAKGMSIGSTIDVVARLEVISVKKLTLATMQTRSTKSGIPEDPWTPRIIANNTFF